MKGSTLLVLSPLWIPSVASTILQVEEAGRNINDNVLAAMNNEELYRPGRRLSEPVVECLDGSDWLNWASVSNGVNLIRKYFDCECTGDLGSFFSMRCELKNYCFFDNKVSDAVNDRRGVLEKCVTRIGTYDFRVDPATRVIYDLARLAESDEFISGFNVTGTIENVNWFPCSNTLVDLYSLNPAEAFDTCNDRERCESFLSSRGYTSEQIEYTCPVVKFDGEECKAFNLAQCADFDPVLGVRYTSMPDCSNVLPCMTSSCQPYVRVSEEPERGLFRYPECHSSDIVVVENPTRAPTVKPSTRDPSPRPSPMPTVIENSPSVAPVIKISTPAPAPTKSPGSTPTEKVQSSGCFLFSWLAVFLAFVGTILV